MSGPLRGGFFFDSHCIPTTAFTDTSSQDCIILFESIHCNVMKDIMSPVKISPTKVLWFGAYSTSHGKHRNDRSHDQTHHVKKAQEWSRESSYSSCMACSTRSS